MFQLELHHLSSKSCFAKGCFPSSKFSYNKGDVITSSSEKNPLTSASSGILSQLDITRDRKFEKSTISEPDAAVQLFRLRFHLLGVGLRQHLQKQANSDFCSLSLPQRHEKQVNSRCQSCLIFALLLLSRQRNCVTFVL